MEKRNKIIYWMATGMFSALLLMGAVMYFLQYEMVSDMFTKLGFPTFIIYPLAIAKILGIAAIITRKSDLLKEWAYAGFFFDLVLATGAHFNIGDGGHLAPLLAIVLLLVSRYFEPDSQVNKLEKQSDNVSGSTKPNQKSYA